MRIGNNYLNNDETGDKISIAQNAYISDADSKWYRSDTAEDCYLIETISNATDTGYIRIARADKGSGEITWVEIARFNHDGTMLLNVPAATPSIAPSASQAKFYIDEFLGRVVAKFKTATETINLLEGDGLSRIWRRPDGTFPAGAKVGDLAIVAGGVGGLRYGEIYATGNAVPTAITVQNTWYQVTIFNTDGLSNDTTPANASDDITIDHTGVYLIVVSAAIKTEGAGTGAVYEFQVEKNSGTVSLANVFTERQLAGGGGDVGSISLSGIVSLSENDTVELWVRNISSTDNIILEDATFSVIEIK